MTRDPLHTGPLGTVRDSSYGPVLTLRDPTSPAVEITATGLPRVRVRFEGWRTVAIVAGRDVELVRADAHRRRARTVRCEVDGAELVLQPTGGRSAQLRSGTRVLAELARARSGERSLTWLAPASVHPTEAALGHAMIAVADSGEGGLA